MGKFVNQTQLTFGNNIIKSNIVEGEILEALIGNKVTLTDQYLFDSVITYFINLTNNSERDISSINIEDNLATYTINNNEYTPLDYIDGSSKLFINGKEEQNLDIVKNKHNVIFKNITLKKNQTITLVYQGKINSYAPLGENNIIINKAKINYPNMTDSLVLESQLCYSNKANIKLEKSIDKTVYKIGEKIKHVIKILNYGINDLSLINNLTIKETFSPIIKNIEVTYNGVKWTNGVNYSYNSTSGNFITLSNQIALFKAKITKNENTNQYNLIPSFATLIIEGNL